MFSFLSIEFSLIFILFFCLYWAFRAKPQIQNLLLLVASYATIYLMASGMAVSILLCFSSVIFALSLAMERYAQHKKKLLWLGIGVTLIQLSWFKYYDFFKGNISAALDAMQLDSSGLMANLVLPLGISYYSFQAISYLVSRYHDEVEVPRFNYAQLLMHFSFFATITAGPIARAKSAKGLTDIQGQSCGMSAQITQSQPRQILYPSLALLLLCLALVKKWWVAGWLADVWVNPVFSNPMQYHSLEVLAAIYGYTLQLFLDFSGYSEMMIAFGLLLGFRLPVNFRAPLLAHNIRDFWDKWHISLSTWIRDYIYIPLGGSRGGFVLTQCNLLLAMVLSGVWHGSGWNFFLWGLLHGMALVLLNCTDKLYEKVFKVSARDARDALYKSSWIGKVLGVFVTVNFVCFAFVFFRAKSFDEAMQVFQALFSNSINIEWSHNPLYLFWILLISWCLYPFVRQLFIKAKLNFDRLPQYALSIPLLIIFLLIVICAPSGIPGFIYANF
ncbi:D-alanyl-lipoteichoic acid acyltransferase DltB (MBOAT superfamily) [Acinetobacter calcoaceticus]|uniref:Probable alginate O-acetylase n=1 Tax=Acinetobacter calcoaceticus TaxID=471 RepID=A0A4V2R1N7_ACICA|nr:D-alanyl-lipoteichoic acid acyltransferase DltB (MBOAT superfamily) [Acinetobacter calcoaceticus]